MVKGFRGSGLESLDQVPGLCKESARVYEDPTTLLGGGGGIYTENRAHVMSWGMGRVRVIVRDMVGFCSALGSLCCMYLSFNPAPHKPQTLPPCPKP